MVCIIKHPFPTLCNFDVVWFMSQKWCFLSRKVSSKIVSLLVCECRFVYVTGIFVCACLCFVFGRQQCTTLSLLRALEHYAIVAIRRSVSFANLAPCEPGGLTD